MTLRENKVSGTTKVRYPELDTLRGFAAVYVMLFHFSLWAGYDSFFLKVGVTGVDLFFIISGYVIFMTLEGTKRPMDFIVSRFSRLFPSYIIMMGITIAVILLFGNSNDVPSPKTVLFNLTMLQPVFFVPYVDDSYWTLTVELLFYAGMLLLFVTQSLKQIIGIGITIIFLLFLYYYFAYTYYREDKLYIIPRSLFPLISHFQLFFSGILFYKMKTEGKKWYQHLMVLACFSFTLYLFDKSGRSHFFIDIYSYAFMILFYLLLFYLFISDKLKFLNLPIFVFLGSISYCLYLIHQKAGEIIFEYISVNYKMNAALIIVILTVLMISIASLVTYKVERPVIRFIRTKYQQLSSKKQ